MDTLGRFYSLKKQALNLLEKFQSKTINDEQLSALANPTEEAIQTINSDKFMVAVVGVIKRGKSTLLNALLRAETDILATNTTPETARLSFLNYAETPKAVIYLNDSTSKDL